MVVVVAFLMDALLALTTARIAGILGSPVRTREPQPASREPSPVHSGLAAVVDVFPLGGSLAGPHGEVVEVNTQGTMMGLARGTRAGSPGLLDWVRQMRRTNTEYPGNVIQDRPPGMDDIEFPTRVLPLDRGFTLVMTEGEAATRRVDAVRRDFVASISHELKTPIGAMGILVETIEAASEDPWQVTHFVRRPQHESARLAELVGQIIELSRLQSSDPMLDRETADAEEIVNEMIGRARGTAGAHRVNLVRVAVPCVRVLGDRWQLAGAVVNLVQDAINHSDDNAWVMVAAARVQNEDDDHVEIMVTDNDIGISQEGQEHIFECFYRVDYRRSRESEGVGLGLSIVRHIALAHKGSVRVWSQPRGGSTSTLRPPAHQDRIADGEAQEEQEMIRILIIEDEDSCRGAPTFIFGKGGSDVTATADGESGPAKYECSDVDPMPLDLMLPGVPGTGMRHRLRTHSDIAIVMVSARSSGTDKVVDLEIGANGYVTKPFSHHEPVARTRATFRRGHNTTLVPEVVGTDGARIDVERHQVFVDGQEVRLALRELELLESLPRNAGYVMTRDQTIGRIQGSNYVDNTKILNVYVKRLRNKIEHEPSEPSRVITVRGLGYRFRG